MNRPPSKKQLAFLRKLGYDGPDPATMDEASWLIDARKSGKKADGLAAAVRRNRRQEAADWISDRLSDKKDSLGLALDEFSNMAGFKLDSNITCTRMAKYAGAFLPVKVVKKWPDLLPPSRSCRADDCNCSCSYDDVDSDDRLRLDMPMVVAPGKVTTIRKHRRAAGRGRTVLLLILIVLIIYWLSR